jgi:hypothetical protein
MKHSTRHITSRSDVDFESFCKTQGLVRRNTNLESGQSIGGHIGCSETNYDCRPQMISILVTIVT